MLNPCPNSIFPAESPVRKASGSDSIQNRSLLVLGFLIGGILVGESGLNGQVRIVGDPQESKNGNIATIRDRDFPEPVQKRFSNLPIASEPTKETSSPANPSQPESTIDSSDTSTSEIKGRLSPRTTEPADGQPLLPQLDQSSHQTRVVNSSADQNTGAGDPKEVIAADTDRFLAEPPQTAQPADDSSLKDGAINPRVESVAASPTGDQADQQTSTWSFQKLTDRKSLPSTVQMIISVAAISLVPAILLMTTCFIRIVVVLGILRQAIGLQQLPPTQVTTALALMMTFLIMAPTWKEVKQNALDPYSAESSEMTWDEAWNAGVSPVKKFMWSQIRRAENENDFWVFYDYLPEEEKSKTPESISDVPLKVLLPAFMISELKVAFLIGIQVLLPFLILDIVVASLCNTMGLIMLPPAVVSLPLKLLLFVMVDGWNLVVTMLLNSFAAL